MIQTYKPTASLVGSERTKENYYQAIKMFILSNEYIGKYLELESEDDGNLKFTLKTKSSLGFSQSIIYTLSSSYHSWNHTGYSGNSISYNIGKDIVFTIIDLPDHILVLLDNMFAFSVAKTSSFDGKRYEFVLITPYGGNSSVIVFKGAETSYCMQINNAIMTECVGYSNTYVLEKLFLSASDLIFNSVYVARGGTTIPPSGMSTIGGRRFYRLFSTNIMFLAE